MIVCTVVMLGVVPTVSSYPADERLDIDLDMERSEVDMPVSTHRYTEVNVQGWVDVIDKPPGENIAVELLVIKPGQDFIGATAYPDFLYFTYTGRRYFNLSLRLQEDTPPGKEYLVSVDANADAKIGYDNDAFHLTVRTVPDLAGKALLIEPPAKVRPGGTTTGTVRVTNDGTRYAEYRLSVRDDPSGCIEDVHFNMEIEMTPNWVEDAPFDVIVSDSTPAGVHKVALDLLVIHDDGSSENVDHFEFEIQVVKP
jgi:hypothetical protein